MMAARRTTGPEPSPCVRRCETARATSCSRGCIIPLPTAYITPHNTLRALYASAVRAREETPKKT